MLAHLVLADRDTTGREKKNCTLHRWKVPRNSIRLTQWVALVLVIASSVSLGSFVGTLVRHTGIGE